MLNEVFITCAVTGAGDTAGRHPDLPVTPAQIADAAIEAAKAGAAIAHVHVRDPETGQGARAPDLFRETVARIRDSDTDVVLNLTTGMGGDFYWNPEDPYRGPRFRPGGRGRAGAARPGTQARDLQFRHRHHEFLR